MATKKSSGSTRVTKSDLEQRVDYLNKKMCKDTKHELMVTGAYGGYKVVLTGKERKDGKGYRGYLGSGWVDITDGYKTARETLNDLNIRTVSGRTKNDINRWDKKPTQSATKPAARKPAPKKK